jgi:hypothetical protein
MLYSCGQPPQGQTTLLVSVLAQYFKYLNCVKIILLFDNDVKNSLTYVLLHLMRDGRDFTTVVEAEAVGEALVEAEASKLEAEVVEILPLPHHWNDSLGVISVCARALLDLSLH